MGGGRLQGFSLGGAARSGCQRQHGRYGGEPRARVPDHAAARSTPSPRAASQRAVAAQTSGFLAGEIAPVKSETFERSGFAPRALKLKGAKELAADTHVRPSPVETLAAIRPAFGGVQTGGNSSAIVDGAAAALVASSDYAKKSRQGARSRAFSPAPRSACRRRSWASARCRRSRPCSNALGSTLSDIDRFEINEAFGAQVMACARELGIDEGKLNVNGGAIAIGHPLGRNRRAARAHAGARARSARGCATASPRPASAAARASRC